MIGSLRGKLTFKQAPLVIVEGQGVGSTLARGLFGLPSVTAGGKIFFGNDRLDLLDRALGRARLDGTGTLA